LYYWQQVIRFIDFSKSFSQGKMSILMAFVRVVPVLVIPKKHLFKKEETLPICISPDPLAQNTPGGFVKSPESSIFSNTKFTHKNQNS